MYLYKKNIQWQETTPTNSTSSTRWIRRWTYNSMKLVVSSFSNIKTISTISWRQSQLYLQRTNADNFKYEGFPQCIILDIIFGIQLR